MGSLHMNKTYELCCLHDIYSSHSSISMVSWGFLKPYAAYYGRDACQLWLRKIKVRSAFVTKGAVQVIISAILPAVQMMLYVQCVTKVCPWQCNVSSVKLMNVYM